MQRLTRDSDGMETCMNNLRERESERERETCHSCGRRSSPSYHRLRSNFPLQTYCLLNCSILICFLQTSFALLPFELFFFELPIFSLLSPIRASIAAKGAPWFAPRKMLQGIRLALATPQRGSNRGFEAHQRNRQIAGEAPSPAPAT